MRAFVIENKHLERKHISFGWGNGYVIIPEAHPMHGVDYNDIDVSVHGGLTFSESAEKLDWPEIMPNEKKSWIIGFDTCHGGDSLERWPMVKVQEEAENLLSQLKS